MVIKKSHKAICVIAAFLTIMSLFFIWQNNAMVITKMNYMNSKIPQGFEGYKIVHISDLHNKSFGKNQEALIKKIKNSYPDIIVVTGDLIDRRKYDLDRAMVFINGAIEIAPVYYVSGNHEAWSGEYENIQQRLESSGVEILDDKKLELWRGKDKIEILGLSDPDFFTSSYMDGTNSAQLEKNLKALSNGSGFKILLSHRPELFDLYTSENIDLAFAGHAHGGQIRLPFIGGLVAPDQGLLPEYTNGAYRQNESTLIVSRGLGNSIFPLRIFNRPEIIEVTLQVGKGGIE